MTKLKLEDLDTSTLLAQFIHKYNADLAQAEDNEDQVELLQAKLEQSYSEHDRVQQANKQLMEEVTAASAQNKRNFAVLEKAEKAAYNQIATQRELALSKSRVTELQKELTALQGGDNPKRLREQIKRIKEKSGSDKKRLSLAESALKEARRTLQYNAKLLTEKDETIRLLNKQLAHNTGSGLYHNGGHHLIIWPEKVKYERPDGSTFEGRSLLYLHQSGRGGLISFDPGSSSAQLCKAPKNGLRPSDACKEFAKDWLFTVNHLQDGVVKEKDMFAVNYNPDLKPQESCLA